MKGSCKSLRGRPYNSGKFGAATKPIRVPINRVEEVYHYLQAEPFSIPLYLTKIPAGFPSPGEDSIDEYIDLNKQLIRKPAATFMLRVSGDSMINAGIFPNDLLIVDRSIDAAHNKIVIAVVNGELTVKRLYKKDGIVRLMPENEAYLPIEIQGELEIWGVVRHAIHSFELL